MEHPGGGKFGQQRRAGRAVRDLAAGQQESDRSTLSVRERVDLGGASSARAPDRLVALPPLPPAAERWAFTADQSIMTCAGGPASAASARNSLRHTPLTAQRT